MKVVTEDRLEELLSQVDENAYDTQEREILKRIFLALIEGECHELGIPMPTYKPEQS